MFPDSYDALPLPPRPNLEQYKKLAKDLAKTATAADPDSLAKFAGEWIGALSRRTELGINSEEWSRKFEGFALQQKSGKKLPLSRAQFVVARVHGFESWPKFARHLEALARENSPVSSFEQAAEAIVAGDVIRLRRLLHKDGKLARARSTRQHRATLLHYIAANGVEGYRQKTPANAVDIAALLLESGADVDAIADLYGGRATTLALVATSIHPEQAGLQESLMRLLIERGASLNSGGGNIVSACLANGRSQAAQFLAAHGAKLDFEAAAGIGRIDLVQSLFDRAAQLEIERGFVWACEYGRNEVVAYLLERGISANTRGNTGQTALHWAVIGAQTETIPILLAKGADLEARNTYGGTVLGQALWSAIHGGKKADFMPVINLLLKSGAAVDAEMQRWLDQQEGVSPEVKQRISARG